MTSREKAYSKTLNDLVSSSEKLVESEVEEILSILDDAAKTITDRIARTEWDMYVIPQLKEAVEEATNQIQQRLTQSLDDSLGNHWNIGLDSIDAPLAAAGISTTSIEVSSAALDIMRGYMPELITGLSSDAKSKINRSIRLGLLGAKSRVQVVNEISTSLDGKKSIFTSIKARAEAIQRTEAGRIQSLARQKRINAVVQNVTDPEIKYQKKWIHSGKINARQSHLITGQLRDLKKKFSNGLLYPHAPGAPASETINCGCLHVLVANWDELPTQYDPVIYQERGNYSQRL